MIRVTLLHAKFYFRISSLSTASASSFEYLTDTHWLLLPKFRYIQGMASVAQCLIWKLPQCSGKWVSTLKAYDYRIRKVITPLLNRTSPLWKTNTYIPVKNFFHYNEGEKITKLSQNLNLTKNWFWKIELHGYDSIPKLELYVHFWAYLKN